MRALDPRARLLLFPLLCVLPLTTQQPGLLLAMLAAAAIALQRTQRGHLRAGITILLAGITMGSIAVWPLFVGGGATLWGPYTTIGLTFGAAMGLRLCTFSLLGLLFMASSSIEEMTWGLRCLGLPFGAAFTVTAAFRLLERTVRTAQAVQAAQRARGLDVARGNVLVRLRNHIPLLMPIFVLSLRRVDGMAMAMEVRGFGSRAARTSLLDSQWRRRDTVVLVVAALVAAAACWARWQGLGVLVSARL